MWFPSWLRNSNRRGHQREWPAFRPTLEALECRWMPSTLTVNSPADSGTGSLRADIAAAHNGDTIVFAPGLDGQTITLTKGELLLNKNLTITGPGAGALAISGSNHSRVFEVAAGVQVNLSGLTISNGVASSANGGGILVDASAALTVSNSTLSGNNASFNRKGVGGHAGGIYNAGTLKVSGCTLSNNCAVAGDSAIYNAGTLTVDTNSAVSSNFAIGIANLGSATISGGNVSDNSLQGIYNFNVGTLKGSDCTLSGNSGYDGGGIYNNGSATITGCTLSDNSAADQGGGIYASTPGGITVTNSTLSGNTAKLYGGGIMVVAGTATITGCTLTGNSAGLGGGVLLYGGTATISDSTLSDNSAAFGGGIYVEPGSSLTVTGSVIGPATVNGIALPGNSATAANGAGGGIYIVSGATVHLDASTVANTINNTDFSGLNSPTANIDGSYTLLP